MFGGSDRTPSLGVEDMTEVEAAAVDEILTCVVE